jgi:hypothetical protein
MGASTNILVSVSGALCSGIAKQAENGIRGTMRSVMSSGEEVINLL